MIQHVLNVMDQQQNAQNVMLVGIEQSPKHHVFVLKDFMMMVSIQLVSPVLQSARLVKITLLVA